MKYVFGPIPSRRLGLSLGVDLTPFKTCSLNCIYCECGSTTCQTIKQKTFFNPDLILGEIKETLKIYPNLDYITFSGSGEPTLYKKIDYLIKKIKEITNVPIALLTNGTLLTNAKVRKQLLTVDLISPSLDSARQSSFKAIDRPHPKLKVSKIIQGLIKFRKEFKGQMWLEIFFVKNINDSSEEVQALINAVKKINPDRIQLNTIDRPPAIKSAQPLNKKELTLILKKFQMNNIKNIEIIKTFKKKKSSLITNNQKLKEKIIALIKRRPETAEHLALALTIKSKELKTLFEQLEKKKIIKTIISNKKIFYALKEK